MDIKFKDSICLGNRVYKAGDTKSVTDATGKELIAKGYAEADEESTEKPKATKKTTTKSE